MGEVRTPRGGGQRKDLLLSRVFQYARVIGGTDFQGGILLLEQLMKGGGDCRTNSQIDARSRYGEWEGVRDEKEKEGKIQLESFK